MDFQTQAFLKRMSAGRDAWLAALLGALAFWVFTGGSILPVQHLDWLLNVSDSAQHYIGWTFFRHQPFLQFPFGQNSAFGESLGSSIVFSDSVPLMAFLFRPFSRWLPGDFQYFGIWLLLCFMLQAVFASKILSALTSDRWLVAAGTCFFILSPAMLFRLSGHEALAGHWTILAALWIFMQPGPAKLKRWALLCSITCMVHAYLAAMVGALWLADLVRRAAFRRIGILRAVVELVLVLAAMLLTAWFTGYFYPGSMQEPGFGAYRFNLGGFFNPLFFFSAFGTGTAYTYGEPEGFSYLGAGMLGLCAMAFTGLFWPHRQALRPTRFTLLPIVLVSLLFVGYAVSNKIAWWGTELWSYEVPSFAEFFTYVFRASGRFIWPVLYWVQIGVLAMVFAWMPGRAARIAVGLALLVQLFDMSTPATYFHDRWRDPHVSRLPSTFWTDVQGRYKRIAFAPVIRSPRGSAEFGLLAARVNMSMNSGYLARVDNDKLEAVAQATARELLERRWRSDTLYVIDDDALWQRLSAQAAATDITAEVDGFRVLAPAWCQGSGTCDVARTLAAINRDRAMVIDFHTGGNARPWLVSGWAKTEAPGTWTVGELSHLRLPVPSEGPLLVTFEYDQLHTLERRGHRVAIRINGHELGAWDSLTPKRMLRQIHVPAEVTALGHGALNVEIEVPDATSPQSIGVNDDIRPLGLYMQRVEVRSLPSPVR